MRENPTSHPEKDRSEVSPEIGAGAGMDSVGVRRPEIHAGGAKGTPLIDPIMLRFRPIAPKPATGDSAAGTETPESFQRPFSRRKVKRKYVRVQKKNQCNVKNDNTNRSAADGGGAAGSDGGGAVETLQLFRRQLESDPLRVQLNSSEILPGTSAATDPKVVESRVTVESVGGTCGGWEHPGTILELDTCPSFVTDYSFSRVMWVNEAYTRLVSGGGGGCGLEVAATVAVRLVVKEELPQWRTAFTCRVRLEHTWQKERYSKLVPCDVWRVDYWGGFAWRLDVKAALSLGF